MENFVNSLDDTARHTIAYGVMVVSFAAAYMARLYFKRKRVTCYRVNRMTGQTFPLGRVERVLAKLRII